MANLITLAEYKESEGIASPKEDLRLNSLIPSVSQLVKTYCGNSLVDLLSQVIKQKHLILLGILMQYS